MKTISQSLANGRILMFLVLIMAILFFGSILFIVSRV